MKYCINCNHKVRDGDNYCTNCGEKIKWPKIEEYEDINNRVDKIKKFSFFDEEMDKLVRKNEEFISNSEYYYHNNVCPYCGVEQKSKIKANKKCKDCGKTIFLRTNMYNRNKMIFKDIELKKYLVFDENVRKILKYEKMMENSMLVNAKYKDYFYELKQKGDLSPRDIIFSYSNYCANEFEKEAIQLYNDALNGKSDPVFEVFKIKRLFNFSTYNWDNISRICEMENKIDIALDNITFTAYRCVVEEMIVQDLDPIGSIESKMSFIESSVNSTIIGIFLLDHNISISEFKKAFMSKNYSFYIFNISKEDVWPIIEKAVVRQYNYTKKQREERNN